MEIRLVFKVSGIGSFQQFRGHIAVYKQSCW